MFQRERDRKWMRRDWLHSANSMDCLFLERYKLAIWRQVRGEETFERHGRSFYIKGYIFPFRIALVLHWKAIQGVPLFKHCGFQTPTHRKLFQWVVLKGFFLLLLFPPFFTFLRLIPTLSSFLSFLFIYMLNTIWNALLYCYIEEDDITYTQSNIVYNLYLSHSLFSFYTHHHDITHLVILAFESTGLSWLGISLCTSASWLLSR
jgi:hypothetical protein